MSELDKTLPIGGGWIYVKKVLPVETYVPALSYWFALPHKVQVRGSNTVQFFVEQLGATQHHSHHRFTQDKYAAALTLLWRRRCGGKLDDIEQDALARMMEQAERPDSVLPAHSDFSDETVSFLDAAVHGAIAAQRERLSFDPTLHLLEETPLEMQVKILTPNGSVILEPQEYEIVDDIKPILARVDGEHFMIKHFGSDKQTARIEEQIHYIRSRGIPREDAISMVMGKVKSQKIFWLEYHRAYAQMYGLSQPNEPVYDIQIPDEDRPRVKNITTGETHVCGGGL